MICCKYVSREELEAGSCHSRVTSVNTSRVPLGNTTTGVRDTSSTNDTSGYREIGGDILCKPVSREERRHRNKTEEHDKLRRWKAAIERDMKADFDAKVEAIRDAHLAQIAEETRQLHSKLVADLQEAQAQAAEEYTKRLRAKAANIREMEALRLVWCFWYLIHSSIASKLVV